MTSFGGEVKLSVPCRRFVACKRSLNVAWKSTFRQNYRTTFSPTVPTSAAGISHVVADVEAPGGEKWERLKSGGKQWQATSKNLPRMQRTRAIPVAWLNSGLCPDRPKGWIPIIIIIRVPALYPVTLNMKHCFHHFLSVIGISGHVDILGPFFGMPDL